MSAVIIRIIKTGEYEAPTAMHDLNGGIRFAVDCMRDPWCPPDVKPSLRRWVEEANKVLLSLQCTSSEYKP